MESIRVSKLDLIETLQKNRTEHREIFLKAQDRYRERVIEELDRRLADAKQGHRIDLYFALPVPEEHTDDYDRILKMLSMSLDDEVMLSESDAAMYVLNQWSWARNFASNTTSYLAS